MDVLTPTPSTARGSVSILLEKAEAGFHWRFPATGTTWEITVCGLDRTAATGLLQRTVQWLHGFEARYSRFQADSLISMLNARAGTGQWTPLTRADEVMFAQAREIWFLSDGLVDPSSLPLTLLWKNAEASGRPPSPEARHAATRLVGWEQVEIDSRGVRLPKPGMGLDFGGFGKELAVDHLARMIAGYGATAGLVNGGGDIATFGHPPDQPCWHVGLENVDPSQTGGRGVGLVDLAVATSGHRHRTFTYEGIHYSHLIDPRTGDPSTRQVESASIVAPSCLQAGLLATAACLSEPAEALARIAGTPLVEGMLQTPRGIRRTAGFDHYATFHQTT